MVTPVVVSQGISGAVVIAALMMFALIYELRRSFDDLKEDIGDDEFESYRKGEMTIQLFSLILTVGYITVVILEDTLLVSCRCSEAAAMLLLLPLITLTGSAAMKWKHVVTGFKH